MPTCITVDLQGQARECLCCLGEVHVCLPAEEQVCVGGGAVGNVCAVATGDTRECWQEARLSVHESTVLRCLEMLQVLNPKP